MILNVLKANTHLTEKPLQKIRTFYGAANGAMQVFPRAIALTIKPRFDVKRTYYVNARLGGEDNNIIIIEDDLATTVSTK